MKYLIVVICFSFFCTPLASADSGVDRPGLQQQEELTSSVARLKDSLRKGEQLDSNVVKDSMSALDQAASHDEPPSHSMMTMVKGLGICVGIFLIGVSIAKRINPRLREVNRDRMHILSRLALTNKTQLLLVTVDGKEILVAVGQEQVALLENQKSRAMVQGKSVLPQAKIIPAGKETECKEVMQHMA